MNNYTVQSNNYYFYGILIPSDIAIELISDGFKISWNEFYTPDVYIEIWDAVNNGNYQLIGVSTKGSNSIIINADVTLNHSISLRALKDNAFSGFSSPVSFKSNVLYASPDGTGDGLTIDNPIELQNALNLQDLESGCIIILTDGIYSNNYISLISGTKNNPIIIRPLNYFKAIIDGSLQIGDYTGKGCYTIVQNLEIFYSSIPRGDWNTPEDLYPRPNSLNIAAPNCLEINNILHDGGIGLVYYQTAKNNIAYGNLCFNNGWPDVAGGGCQSTYYHGSNQIVKHNMFIGGFKRTFANYGTNDGTYDHELTENIIIEPKLTGEILSGSENVTNKNIKAIGNHTFGANFIFGWHTPNNDGLLIQDNRCYRPFYQYYGTIETVNWKNVTIKNNIIIGQAVWYGADNPENNYIAEGNKYFSVGNIYPICLEGVAANKTLAQWQSLGFDLTGSFDLNLPLLNEIFVYKNEYLHYDNIRKGIVVIWNWESLNNVSVNLSSLGLVIGSTYRWRQSQDPLKDVGYFIYDGLNVNFSMIDHTISKPIGSDELLMINTFPLFGCFIIESV